MKFYLAGQWQDRDDRIDVVNPFNNELIDTVPRASTADVDTSLACAAEATSTMAVLTLYERAEILKSAARLLSQRRDHLAETISREEGKTIRESMAEVIRSADTMELSAEEAKRLTGETLPLDSAKGIGNKLGFTLRVPCGVVAAITPFNFPLNLVCHKIGPAIAGGNSAILKPASDTPLVALKLVEILLEAGLPENGIQCITGNGSQIGAQICSDSRVRKISFTGSQDVGEQICKMAGMKKVTMELGSNCPLIVLPDADLDKVAKVAASHGFANAGQVCISAQRLVVADEVHDEFVHKLVEQINSIQSGDQLDTNTNMGPMVRPSDAERVEAWVQEAVHDGAKLIAGGGRSGSLMEPTLLINAQQKMKVVRQEVFGPTVAVLKVKNVEEAIELANDSRYGLSAGVFTQNVDTAMRFAREVHSGNIHINWGPMWRTDGMPYGGLKASGLGKEGPKYALEEMTESKAVVFH